MHSLLQNKMLRVFYGWWYRADEPCSPYELVHRLMTGSARRVYHRFMGARVYPTDTTTPGAEKQLRMELESMVNDGFLMTCVRCTRYMVTDTEDLCETCSLDGRPSAKKLQQQYWGMKFRARVVPLLQRV
jgi:hypothetical protein